MALTKAYSSRLSLFQKKSVFKIVLELVKADNQIHRNEVALLSSLQDTLGLGQEDLDMVHYVSLEEAVSSLRDLPESDVDVLLGLFEDIIRVDNDVDFSENLLFCALKMSLGKDSGQWSGVVSIAGIEAETSSEQIIYLEDGICAPVHKVFDDEYDYLLVSKALGDAGFRLFYLPEVIRELEADGKYELLQRSMGYLVPSGDKKKIRNLKSALRNLGEGDLYQVILSRYNIAPARIPSGAFLFLKVREGYVMDDDDQMRRSVDFLYMDISGDVKKRILSFVSQFDVNPLQLSYEGFYKILFDYFSAESKSMSHIVLDGKWNFCLSDGSRIDFQSSPQARTFYLLLLHYGAAGVSQKTFADALSLLENVPDGAFDLLSFREDLLRNGSEAALLLYNTIIVYSNLSTKDTREHSFLGYIESILRYRSSLKNYVNKGFSGASVLANNEQYYIGFNPGTRSYYLSVSPSLFFHDGSPLSSSAFWKCLK